MRPGLIVKKLGMSRVFDENGRHEAVTLFKLEDSYVVGVKNGADGKGQVQIAAGDVKVSRMSKAVRGIYSKAKVEPRAIIREFKVEGEALNVQPGSDKLSVNYFVVGQNVDAEGVTIGRGFTGVLKRWNMRRQKASHGNSLTTRQRGSTGMNQDPGRVPRGTRMAGHYGATQVTVQNLEVIQVVEDQNLIVVRGSVPGAKNEYIVLTDAVKRQKVKDVPKGLVFASSQKNEKPSTDAAVDITEGNREEGKA